MRALIIDDEAHCRNVIRKLVAEFCSEITLMDEADSVETGIEKINSFKPELVFLDIQLGDLTSFDLLEQLNEINFQIIFTTAYDNYAIKVFEYAALHYLLKPIAPTELIKAIKRCNKKELIYEKETLNKTNGFYLKTHENTYDVVYNQVIYIKADGSYSTIFNNDKQEVYTSKKLSQYSNLLNDSFFRIHNSFIVNMQFVDHVEKQGFKVSLTTKEKLPISRRKKAAFKEALQKFKARK